jgi:glycosyltransferase involved in cell wall biosynthesis
VVAVSKELVAQLGLPNSIVMPGAVGDDVLSIPAGRKLSRSGPFRLVYAGSLARAKGVHELVSAVQAMSNVVVSIVGSGPELAALGSRAGPRVIVHGEITRQELMHVYAEAHAAVNPHVMLDTMVGAIFPFKIIEYVAAGLPVISTRLGTTPKAIAPAIVAAASSSSSDLSAAIETAQSQYSLLAEAAETARRSVQEEYSTEALARKLDDVLRRARSSSL